MAEEEFSASGGEMIFPDGTLLGNYRIDGFFALSSMGALYSGTDLTKGQSCSIHVISSAITGHSPDVAARLLNRAQEACFFRHKNFISIETTFSIGDVRCIITELIEGLSLREFVDEGRVLPAPPREIAKQLAALAGAAEKTGKIYFDFNPDDIYITPGGVVKVLYPGVNNQIHLLSGATLRLEPELCHNAPFTAPEQLLGNSKSTFASSVYAIGIIWSYMLSGRIPYAGEELFKILARAAAGEVELPDDSGQRNAIKLLTAKDPARRPGAPALQRLFGAKNMVLPFVAAAALLLVCAAAFLVWKGVSAKRVSGGEDEISAGLKKYEIPRKSPLKKQKFSAPVKESAAKSETPKTSVQEPLHAAAKKIAAPEVRLPLWQTEKLIEYSRSRLERLEKDLAENKVDPRLMQLHKERIEFRKRQVIALSRRRNTEEHRRESRKTQLLDPVNREIRKEVEGYFARCRRVEDFARSKALVAQGKAQPFPVEKLKRANVDFSMFFPFQVDHAALSRISVNGRRGTTLAQLMLGGYMIKSETALQILYDAQAPLKELQMPFALQLFRSGGIPEPQLRYLIREMVMSRHFFSVELITSRVIRNTDEAKILLDEMLLLGMPTGYRDGATVLHRMAALDRKEFIPQLLRAEFPLEATDNAGRTPLFYAYMNGSTESAALLLAAGADPEHRDHSGKKASDWKETGVLAAAVRERSVEKAQSAIDKGADVNTFLHNGDTPLITACRKGDVRMVQLLVEKGASLDKRNRRGETPLGSVFLGTAFPHPAVFEYLLSRNADVSAEPYGWRKGHGFLSLLFDTPAGRHKLAPRFAEIMLKSGKFSMASQQLFKVCRERNTPLFRALVQHWHEIGKSEYSGLYLEALKAGMGADVIRLLLERKVPFPEESTLKSFLDRFGSAEIRSLFPDVSRSGQSAATVPAAVPAPAVFRISLGTPVPNGKISEKLLKALKRERRSELESLLDEGANPDSVLIDGMTLLQHAVLQDSPVLITVLLKKNADPFKIGYSNKTLPLMLAVEKDALNAFRVLIRQKPMPANFYWQLFEAIVKKRNSSSYIREFLKYHGSELKSFPVCYLTAALRMKAEDDVLLALMELYGDLSKPKHRAAVHQAVASGYRPEVIKTLLRSKGSVKGKAHVMLSGKNERRYFNGTVLEIAAQMKSPRIIFALLRNGGAR